MDLWLEASTASKLRENQIAGPVFISIGDREKVNLFLEKNPKVPRSYLLVDDYEFGAYNAIGYGKLMENQAKTIEGSKTMKMPKFGLGRWKDYLTSVGKLSPIPPGSPTSFPEGVLRLGGTLALNQDKIVYSYEDGVPGDHPNPVDVIKSLVF